MTRLLAVVLTAISLVSCSQSEPDARVLFVGNSYTSTNNLPAMVVDLAASVDVNLETTMEAPGGRWLRDHVTNEALLADIESGRYDYVVIQEQSAIPSSLSLAEPDMFPPAHVFSEIATNAGTRLILFQTWGYRDGFTDTGHSTYASMQQAIIDTYSLLEGQIGRQVAPVGQAFSLSFQTNPGVTLHQADGSHPSRQGSYLAAAVFASVLTGISPVEMTESLGLDESVASRLRVTAATVTK